MRLVSALKITAPDDEQICLVMSDNFLVSRAKDIVYL
jgi:hypothetical protein